MVWLLGLAWHQRRVHSLSGCVNLDSTPLLLGGTGVYCPTQSHYCSWSWNWVFLLRCGLGWNPIRFTPLKFLQYLQIYCSWNCPLPLGLVSPIQVFKQILGCCHQVLFFQTELSKWRLKKITVQGSGVKQRLMITGLVSWVIISTFYIGWKVWTGKCSRGLFLREGVDLEWVSYTPLHLKSNPLLIPLLHKEWSVPNPIHPLPWSWVWSGVSRSEPVSGCDSVAIK